jgi:hypothetical protein
MRMPPSTISKSVATVCAAVVHVPSMLPPGGSGTAAVRQSGSAPLESNARRAPLESAVRMVKKTSMPGPLPHPDRSNAVLIAVDRRAGEVLIDRLGREASSSRGRRPEDG